MIKIGIVNSIHKVASSNIISVKLLPQKEVVNLDNVSVKFEDNLHESILSGYKWWFEEKSVDLFFDKIEDLPQLGVPVYIV